MIYYKGLVTIMFFILLFVLVSNCLEYDFVFASGELRCKAKERDALLKFKQGLIDEYGILSSWGSEDDKKECCEWDGIECSNETGHVIGLLLQRTMLFSDTRLRGKISSALLELSYLNHLDLSYNDFGYNEIPEFIGSLHRLQYLHLRYSNFSGVVPHQLGNLTNLKSLDLSKNELVVKNCSWLSHLSLLSLLDLSTSYLQDTNLLQYIVKLSSLTELHLGDSNLSGVVPHELGNLTNLRTLDLSWNGLVFKNCSWLSHLSLLSVLDLSQSYLEDTNLLQYIVKLPSMTKLYLSSCHIPTHFYVNSSSTTLSILDLSYSSLTSSSFHWLFNISTNLRRICLSNNHLSAIPDAFRKFTFLEYLDLSFNEITGGIPKSLGNLSHLEVLYLRWNQITGSVPDLSALVSLKELHLSKNKLKLLPASLWHLFKLEILDVSFNSIEGTISDVDLSKLHKLKVLDLSFNSLVLNVTADWIPSFKLDQISLACCQMDPRFPTWLQTQTRVSNLDLSSTGISDEAPKWLWDLSKGMSYLNLSHNQISGTIPDFPMNSTRTFVLDISFNNFAGHLPLFHPGLWILRLNNNMFLGPISSICTIAYDELIVLELSNNQFSGELPNCWNIIRNVMILSLANNKLSGHIPHSLGSQKWLRILHLPGNNFSGELPSTLKNCQNLVMIDVRGNKLTGDIPVWIGTHLTNLTILGLGHNNFHGSIPPEICYLTSIQVLDLSGNFISGTIPQCFNNFTYLGQKNRSRSTIPFMFGFSSYIFVYFDYSLVQWKGQETKYWKALQLLKLIDLSSNRLVGNIPLEFSHLRALVSLNLSRNNLSGNIIPNIGQMEMIESLDLSRNQLFGEIPISLTELHFLQVLDLSYNKLSGKIPSSTQLQSFNASMYAGNGELCGFPLTSCPGDGPNSSIIDYGKRENGDEDDNNFITHEFIISMVLGFICGFWGVVGTLVIKNSWRNAYFNCFNKIRDWMYVTITLQVVKFKDNSRANAHI